MNKKSRLNQKKNSTTSLDETSTVSMEIDIVKATYGVDKPSSSRKLWKSLEKNSQGKGKDKVQDLNRADDRAENEIEDDARSETSSTADYEFVSKATIYSAYFPADAIAGKNDVIRIKECFRIFARFPSFIKAMVFKSNGKTGKDKFLRIYFTDKSERDKAAKEKSPTSEITPTIDTTDNVDRKFNATSAIK